MSPANLRFAFLHQKLQVLASGVLDVAHGRKATHGHTKKVHPWPFWHLTKLLTMGYLSAMRLRDLHKTMNGHQRRELAQRVGVSPGYLWQIATGWENSEGRIKRPSLDLLAKLAAADARLHVHDMVAEFSAPADKASA